MEFSEPIADTPGTSLDKNKCGRDPNQQIFQIPTSTELTGLKKIAEAKDSMCICSEELIFFRILHVFIYSELLFL